MDDHKLQALSVIMSNNENRRINACGRAARAIAQLQQVLHDLEGDIRDVRGENVMRVSESKAAKFRIQQSVLDKALSEINLAALVNDDFVWYMNRLRE